MCAVSTRALHVIKLYIANIQNIDFDNNKTPSLTDRINVMRLGAVYRIAIESVHLLKIYVNLIR